MPPDKNTCDGDDGTYNKGERREGDDHSDRYDHLLAEIASKLLATVVLVNASLRPPARFLATVITSKAIESLTPSLY